MFFDDHLNLRFRFSTDYQFDLVRSIFTYTPDYQLIDAPFQLQNPKRLYAPLKFKPKKEKPVKKDPKAVKGKKKDVDTEEFLALMEVILFYRKKICR